MDCSLPGSSIHGDSPGNSTGVGCHALLQGIFPTQGSNPGLLHCRWILYHLSHQGSPRILEWVAYSFSRGSFWPRNRTGVSCIAGRFCISWALSKFSTQCRARTCLLGVGRRAVGAGSSSIWGRDHIAHRNQHDAEQGPQVWEAAWPQTERTVESKRLPTRFEDRIPLRHHQKPSEGSALSQQEPRPFWTQRIRLSPAVVPGCREVQAGDTLVLFFGEGSKAF